MSRVFHWLIAVLIFAVPATYAKADVLVNNLNTNYGAATYAVCGNSRSGGAFGQTSEAVCFTTPSTSNFCLNYIDVIGKYVSGNSTSFQLALYTDSSMHIPGTEIASEALSADKSGTMRTYSANFGNSVVLSAGQTYWAVVQAPGSDIDLALLQGTSLGTHRNAMYGNMGRSGVAPYWMYMDRAGFEVLGSPAPSSVPEPSGLVAGTIFSMLGLLKTGIRLRRK